MAGESSDIMATFFKPEAGQTRRFGVEPGCRYALGFDPATAIFGSKGGTLSAEFEDGAILLLDNFFPAVTQGNVLFSLPDGLEVSGRDIAESLYMVMKDFTTQGEDGEEAAATAVPSSNPPAGSFEAMIEEGSSIGPVCHTVCALPSSSVFGAAPDDLGPEAHEAIGYFITPHTTIDSAGLEVAPHHDALPGGAADSGVAGPFPRAVPASDTIEEPVTSSSLLFSPQGRTGGVLLLEDLLDTTLPQTFSSNYTSPAFESLLSTSHLPDMLQGRAVPVNESDCLLPSSAALPENADDGQDDLLLAFLQMGSF